MFYVYILKLIMANTTLAFTRKFTKASSETFPWEVPTNKTYSSDGARLFFVLTVVKPATGDRHWRYPVGHGKTLLLCAVSSSLPS